MAPTKRLFLFIGAISCFFTSMILAVLGLGMQGKEGLWFAAVWLIAAGGLWYAALHQRK